MQIIFPLYGNYFMEKCIFSAFSVRDFDFTPQKNCTPEGVQFKEGVFFMNFLFSYDILFFYINSQLSTIHYQFISREYSRWNISEWYRSTSYRFFPHRTHWMSAL